MGEMWNERGRGGKRTDRASTRRGRKRKRERERDEAVGDRRMRDEARSVKREYRQRVTIPLVVICRQIRHRDNAAKIIMGAHRVPAMGGLSEITVPTRYLL